MSKKLAVSILLGEYKEVKQELRDLMKSTDIIMRTCLIFIGAFVAASVQMDDPLPICLIPSILFLFSIIYALKAFSMNNLGTYVQHLDIKFKKLVDKEHIGMCWEGYYLWEKQSRPTGLVVITLFILFSCLTIFFILISIYSYALWPFSVVIHAIEAIILITLIILVLRDSSIQSRQDNLKKLEESIKNQPEKIVSLEGINIEENN